MSLLEWQSSCPVQKKIDMDRQVFVNFSRTKFTEKVFRLFSNCYARVERQTDRQSFVRTQRFQSWVWGGLKPLKPSSRVTGFWCRYLPNCLPAGKQAGCWENLKSKAKVFSGTHAHKFYVVWNLKRFSDIDCLLTRHCTIPHKTFWNPIIRYVNHNV